MEIQHKQVTCLLPPNEKLSLFWKPICKSGYGFHDSFQTNTRRVLTRKMKYRNLSFFLVWNVVRELLPIKYLKAERKKCSHGRLHEYKLNFEFTEHIPQIALIPQWFFSPSHVTILPIVLVMKETLTPEFKQSNMTKGFGQNQKGWPVTKVQLCSFCGDQK